MDFKKCADCGEIKKEKNFRYIKYLRKYRSICKRCEAKGKIRKRRIVRSHVKKHGVTEKVLHQLQWAATSKVNQIAYKMRASQFPDGEFARQQRIYNVLDYILLYLRFFSCIGFLWFMFIGSSQWMFLAIVIFCVALVLDKFYCQPRLYQSPHISKGPIWEAFLKEGLQKRKEYERFYVSQEWRIVRTEFLEKQKKVNGYYICKLCDKPIHGLDVTVDHQKPRSKYPELALDITNLAVAHRACNSSKGAKEFD